MIYIDDLVIFLKECKSNKVNITKSIKDYVSITPKLAEILKYFQINRNWFGIKDIDPIVLKILYSLTYVPSNKYVYRLRKKKIIEDILQNFKMGNSGQVSYFTIKKGKERGMHYHNTKIEKFLILKGRAKFQFKNLLNNKIKTYILRENEHKVINNPWFTSYYKKYWNGNCVRYNLG